MRVSRLYRDLRLWSIGGGADEVKYIHIVTLMLMRRCLHILMLRQTRCYMYICADADAYEAEALHENIFTSAHLPALSDFECGFVSS